MTSIPFKQVSACAQLVANQYSAAASKTQAKTGNKIFYNVGDGIRRDSIRASDALTRADINC